MSTRTADIRTSATSTSSTDSVMTSGEGKDPDDLESKLLAEGVDNDKKDEDDKKDENNDNEDKPSNTNGEEFFVYLVIPAIPSYRFDCTPQTTMKEVSLPFPPSLPNDNQY